MTTAKCTFYSFSVDFSKSVSKMEIQKLKCFQQNSLQEERSRPVLARTIEMFRKGCCKGTTESPRNRVLQHRQVISIYIRSLCFTQVMDGVCEVSCTCARADRTSVYVFKFGMWVGVTKCVLSTSHGWGGASMHVRTSARAHVHSPPPHTSVPQDPIDQFC